MRRRDEDEADRHDAEDEAENKAALHALQLIRLMAMDAPPVILRNELQWLSKAVEDLILIRDSQGHDRED